MENIKLNILKFVVLSFICGLTLLILCTSCLPDQPVTESVKRKTAVVCKDSVRIVWDENLLVQTSWLTSNPCYDHGGTAYFIYK